MDDEEYQKQIKLQGSWITKEYLEELLSKKLGKFVAIQEYTIKAGVPIGQNYLSILYKVSIIYTVNKSAHRKDCHLMIKQCPDDPAIVGFLEQLGAFQKETIIYNELFPKINAHLEEYFPTDGRLLAPEGYATTRPGTLVMEDISFGGYNMLNREDQMDLEHTIGTVNTLARFHAVCCKVEEDYPNLIQRCSSLLHTDANRPALAPFIYATTSLAQSMKTWPEYESLKEIVSKLFYIGRQYSWEKIGVLERPNKIFNCLNHGDLWMNNFMFKHNPDGSLHSVKFVDFQLSRYTTPILDLDYLLFSSAQPEVVCGHLFEVLNSYYKTFMSDSATLGLSINYPHHLFLEQLNESAVYATGVLATMRTFVLAPAQGLGEVVEGPPKDSEEEAEAKNLFEAIYVTDKYRQTTIEVLEYLNEIGLLDEAMHRMQYVVSEMQEKEQDADIGMEEKPKYARVMTAHERNILARIKSSVRGAFRKFFDLQN